MVLRSVEGSDGSEGKTATENLCGFSVEGTLCPSPTIRDLSDTFYNGLHPILRLSPRGRNRRAVIRTRAIRYGASTSMYRTPEINYSFTILIARFAAVRGLTRSSYHSR